MGNCINMASTDYKSAYEILKHPFSGLRRQVADKFFAQKLLLDDFMEISKALLEEAKQNSKISAADLSLEIKKAYQFLKHGETDEIPDVSDSPRQLIWGMALACSESDPEVRKNWPAKLGSSPIHKLKVWNDIKNSPTANMELRRHAFMIRKMSFLPDEENIAMRWGSCNYPDVGFYFDKENNRINLDLLWGLVGGFEHSRAIQLHEIGHGYGTLSFGKKMEALKKEFDELNKKAREGKITKEEYQRLREVEREHRFRFMIFDEAENSYANRFATNASGMIKQDVGYDLNAVETQLFTVGESLEKNKNGIVEVEDTLANRAQNLKRAIRLSFFVNNGIVKDEPEEWRKLGVNIDWIEYRTADNQKVSGMEAFKKLRDMTSSLEELQIKERDYYKSDEEVYQLVLDYADKRADIIDNIFDMYAMQYFEESIREKEQEGQEQHGENNASNNGNGQDSSNNMSSNSSGSSGMSQSGGSSDEDSEQNESSGNESGKKDNAGADDSNEDKNLEEKEGGKGGKDGKSENEEEKEDGKGGKDGKSENEEEKEGGKGGKGGKSENEEEKEDGKGGKGGKSENEEEKEGGKGGKGGKSENEEDGENDGSEDVDEKEEFENLFKKMPKADKDMPPLKDMPASPEEVYKKKINKLKKKTQQEEGEGEDFQNVMEIIRQSSDTSKQDASTTRSFSLSEGAVPFSMPKTLMPENEYSKIIADNFDLIEKLKSKFIDLQNEYYDETDGVEVRSLVPESGNLKVDLPSYIERLKKQIKGEELQEEDFRNFIVNDVGKDQVKAPIDIVILIDNSGSMSYAGTDQFAIELACSLFQATRDNPAFNVYVAMMHVPTTWIAKPGDNSIEISQRLATVYHSQRYGDDKISDNIPAVLNEIQKRDTQNKREGLVNFFMITDGNHTDGGYAGGMVEKIIEKSAPITFNWLLTSDINNSWSQDIIEEHNTGVGGQRIEYEDNVSHRNMLEKIMSLIEKRVEDAKKIEAMRVTDKQADISLTLEALGQKNGGCRN